MSDQVDQLVAKITNLAETQGPQAVSLALQGIRIEGIMCLLGGVICSGIAVIGAILCRRWVAIGNETNREGYKIAAIIMGFVSILLLIIGFVQLMDYSNWIAAFNPAMFAVLRAIHSI